MSISKKHNKKTRSNGVKFKNSFCINRTDEILESFAKLGCGWVYPAHPHPTGGWHLRFTPPLVSAYT